MALAGGVGAFTGGVSWAVGRAVNPLVGKAFKVILGQNIDCRATTPQLARALAAHGASGTVNGWVTDAAAQGAGLAIGFRDHWDGNRWKAAGVTGGIGGVLMSYMMRSCFAAGAPLLTTDGHRVIERFVPGDRVLSRTEFDPDGPLEAKEVEEVSSFVWPTFCSGRPSFTSRSRSAGSLARRMRFSAFRYSR